MAKIFEDMEVFLFFLMKQGGARVKFLPELYYLFGEELLNEFIEVFCGCTIKIPDKKCISETSKRFVIWKLHQKGKTEEEILQEIGPRGHTKVFVRNSIKLVAKSVRELEKQFRRRVKKNHA